MIKFLFFLFTLITIIDARENPFFPAEGEMDILLTSNISTQIPALKRATLTLPPQARVIQKVTIEYKNLDGSISNESIVLNNSVDWHLPIFISQNYDTSLKKEKKKINKEFKQVAFIKYAKFYTSEKTLKIVTKDKILRNFLLVQPHRIVVDFDRDTSLRSLTKTIKNNIFSKVRVANHDGYYRAVIELDGYYRYKMKKTSDGYIFKLR
ncbi:MAG: AMIN domain-containing protein [Campylobacterota bacterium]|nr:AMIN domain-containing protein [Campylobacterota bacterium]